MQLSALYGLPHLDLPAAFSEALKRQLWLHFRQEKQMAMEQTSPSLEDTNSPQTGMDNAFWQLLSLNSNSVRDATPDKFKQRWLSLQQETQQLLYQEALRSVLHPQMGPALIKGPTAHLSFAKPPLPRAPGEL